MTTLVELTEITSLEAGDLLLTRQGGRDGATPFTLSKEGLYPVGYLLFLDKPSTLLSPSLMGLTGTWEVVEEDASFSPVVNQVAAGLGDYVNVAGFSRAVKLPAHTHTITLSVEDGHDHQILVPTSAGVTDIRDGGFDTRAYRTAENSYDKTLTSSGAHTHDVVVSTTGTESVEISIKGKFVTFVVWRRVA
jgi:hypothetical protein